MIEITSMYIEVLVWTVLTITGWCELVIDLTCDEMHMPTYFLQMAIIGMYSSCEKNISKINSPFTV